MDWVRIKKSVEPCAKHALCLVQCAKHAWLYNNVYSVTVFGANQSMWGKKQPHPNWVGVLYWSGVSNSMVDKCKNMIAMYPAPAHISFHNFTDDWCSHSMVLLQR